MDHWEGKVAVVTGASAGIGAAIAADLVRAGMSVVGLARRKERVEALGAELTKAGVKGKLYAVGCDVSMEENVQTAFRWVTENLGGTDVLVNNAGLLRPSSLLDPKNGEAMRAVLATNVTGLCYCTREAFQSMKDRDGGHIIHINSVAGHGAIATVPGQPPMLNVYPASKYAVTALTEMLRQELNYLKSNIKITSISPGLVLTDMVSDIFGNENGGPGLLDAYPSLKPEDISQAVLYVLGTPPHVQVHELIIKPLREMF